MKEELNKIFNEYIFDDDLSTDDLKRQILELFDTQKAQFKADLEGLKLANREEKDLDLSRADDQTIILNQEYNEAVDEFNQKIDQVIKDL